MEREIAFTKRMSYSQDSYLRRSTTVGSQDVRETFSDESSNICSRIALCCFDAIHIVVLAPPLRTSNCGFLSGIFFACRWLGLCL